MRRGEQERYSFGISVAANNRALTKLNGMRGASLHRSRAIRRCYLLPYVGGYRSTIYPRMLNSPLEIVHVSRGHSSGHSLHCKFVEKLLAHDTLPSESVSKSYFTD